MVIFSALACVLLPAIALWAEKRFTLFRKLGAVVVCYILGIGVAAAGLAPAPEIMQQLYGPAALLAVPAVLFSADLPAWLRQARTALRAFAGAVLAAVLGACLAYLFVGPGLAAGQAPVLTGMAVGVYTGGTPNLNAIALALDAPETLIVQANLADTLFFLPYFLFVMTVASRWLGRWLKPFPYEKVAGEPESPLGSPGLWRQVWWYSRAFLLAAACLGLSVGISWGITGGLDMAVVVSLLTLSGLAASLIPEVRRLPGTYSAGEYFLLIFCVGIGMALDLDSLARDLLPVVGFMFITAGSGVVIHVLLARMMKVDVDTFIITSVAAICSPLFVPPVARALKNREIITTGMTTGVVGFAIGNWLGLAIAHVLG